MSEIEPLWEEALGKGSLTGATLSEARARQEDGLRRVTVRPVTLRKRRVYQFEYQYAQKVQHKNLDPSEAGALIRTLLVETFRQGHFQATTGDFHVSVGRAGKAKAAVQAPAATLAASPEEQGGTAGGHDRQKNYLLAEGAPIDFLVRLGVMTGEGRVVAARRDKFKQINRFLEMVDDVAGGLPKDGSLHVIDFGCGKAYLTFALYYYFTVLKQRQVRLVGLDLKPDVVAFCAQVAQDLDYTGLTFALGDIQGYQAEGEDPAVDMVVTLHACDTATDDALVKAIGWNARVILSVPCCQHELFGQLAGDVMRPLLKHGILKERLTALVTDSIRASLLESAGYSVQILEFIALEHTAKNLLLRAVRRGGQAAPKPPSAEYAAFRDFWHVRPHMEAALGAPAKEQEAAQDGAA